MIFIPPRLDDRNAEAHKWFAIVLGSRGEFGGVRYSTVGRSAQFCCPSFKLQMILPNPEETF